MHTMDTMHTFLEYMKKKYNDTKVEDTVRRKIYSQTNVYPSARAFLGRCAGVQVCRCPEMLVPGGLRSCV